MDKRDNKGRRNNRIKEKGRRIMETERKME